MPKKIIFNKYQARADDYHWQQISRNIFRFNAFVMARYQQVVSLIPKKKDLKILDIGCGDGVLLSLIPKGKKFGVDLDKDSLNYARNQVKGKFIRAQATKLPFSNNFFDIVVTTELIEHLVKPKRLISEAARVLKRGGKIIITTPKRQPNGLTDPLHVQEFFGEELINLLQPKFTQIRVLTTHSLRLKKFYIKSMFKLRHFYFEPGRWLINILVLVTGWNPFKLMSANGCQLTVIARKI